MKNIDDIYNRISCCKDLSAESQSKWNTFLRIEGSLKGKWSLVGGERRKTKDRHSSRENSFPISCWLPLSGRRSIKPAPSRRVSGYLNALPPLMYTFPRRFVLGNALSLFDQRTLRFSLPKSIARNCNLQGRSRFRPAVLEIPSLHPWKEEGATKLMYIYWKKKKKKKRKR